MSTTKKVLNVIIKIITYLLVAFTVFIMIFTIFSVSTVNKNERSILGLKFYIVKTDSMSLSENNKDMAVHFNAGDMIIVKNPKDPSAFKDGDIITFMSINSDSYGETITHMVRRVEKNAEGKVIGYVTFGTNTGVDDEAVVEPAYVMGSYATKIPAAGHFFAFVKSTPGYIVCILVPFLLLILYNGVNVIRLFRKYKREQVADMAAEREKIDADRAETQRMMQELLALKAQLEQKNNEAAPQAEPAPEVKPEETAPAAETVVEETVAEEAVVEETVAEETVVEEAVEATTEETAE